MFPRRYSMIEGWRGLASLSIVFHHLYSVQDLAIREYLGLGVPVFFVISGYCISAAVDSGVEKDLSVGGFMRRRVRRIAPPYVSSVLLALALFWGRSLYLDPNFSLGKDLGAKWLMYVQNLTMTQWLSLVKDFVLHGNHISAPWMNPVLLIGVYWSLNYEEQFYLLNAFFVRLARAKVRWYWGAFTALTLAAFVFNAFAKGVVTGFFLDYWFQFACGGVVFAALCKAGPRARWALTGGVALTFLGFLGMAVHYGELHYDTAMFQPWIQGTVCLGFSLVLLLLRPFDDRVREWKLLTKPLFALGAISYSLYLVHFPFLVHFGQYYWKARELFGLHPGALLAAAALIGVSTAFYWLAERPFLNARLDAKPAPAAAQPVTPVAA